MRGRSGGDRVALIEGAADFGMGGFVPVVGDNVELKIIVAFQK